MAQTNLQGESQLNGHDPILSAPCTFSSTLALPNTLSQQLLKANIEDFRLN